MGSDGGEAMKENGPMTTVTPQLLAQRMRRVGIAFRAQDEDGARAELRLLAQEARALALSEPLFRLPPTSTTSVEHRQAIKLQSKRGGFMG